MTMQDKKPYLRTKCSFQYLSLFTQSVSYDHSHVNRILLEVLLMGDDSFHYLSYFIRIMKIIILNVILFFCT